MQRPNPTSCFLQRRPIHILHLVKLDLHLAREKSNNDLLTRTLLIAGGCRIDWIIKLKSLLKRIKLRRIYHNAKGGRLDIHCDIFGRNPTQSCTSYANRDFTNKWNDNVVIRLIVVMIIELRNHLHTIFSKKWKKKNVLEINQFISHRKQILFRSKEKAKTRIEGSLQYSVSHKFSFLPHF